MVEPRRTAEKTDWRSAATYEYTEGLPRLAWAWEFLRRNPKYRQAYAGADFRAIRRHRQEENLTVITMEEEQPAAKKWGLLLFRGSRKNCP